MKHRVAVPLPMVATKYVPGSLTFPCAIHPWSNGVRAIAHLNYKGRVVLTGLFGTEYTTSNLDKIRESLSPIFDKNPHLILDGELCVPGFGFYRNEEACLGEMELVGPIRYHVFDVVSEEPYKKRMETVKTLDLGDHLVDVPVETCNAESDVDQLRSKYTRQAYHGVYLRDYDSVYEQGAHSSHFMKVTPYPRVSGPETMFAFCLVLSLFVGFIVHLIKGMFLKN